MQTFLPSPDFSQSSKFLDYKRYGSWYRAEDVDKIKSEIKQIADWLDKPETPLDNATCRRVSYLLRRIQ